MPQQYPFFFGNASLTNDATALSILALIQAASFQPTGPCVSLNVTFNTNTYWGYASTVTNTDGALVPANTPVSDSGVGALSDTVPISQMYVYNHSGGTASGVIYARFIP